MKTQLASWLRAAADWLAPPVPDPDFQVVKVPKDRLFVRALVYTAAVRNQDTSGEYKRHHVLAYLQKEFPQRPLSDLSRAIEAALCL